MTPSDRAVARIITGACGAGTPRAGQFRRVCGVRTIAAAGVEVGVEVGPEVSVEVGREVSIEVGIEVGVGAIDHLVDPFRTPRLGVKFGPAGDKGDNSAGRDHEGRQRHRRGAGVWKKAQADRACCDADDRDGREGAEHDARGQRSAARGAAEAGNATSDQVAQADAHGRRRLVGETCSRVPADTHRAAVMRRGAPTPFARAGRRVSAGRGGRAGCSGGGKLVEGGRHGCARE